MTTLTRSPVWTIGDRVITPQGAGEVVGVYVDGSRVQVALDNSPEPYIEFASTDVREEPTT